MTRTNLAVSALLAIVLAACASGPPAAPIGLHKMPANPLSKLPQR